MASRLERALRKAEKRGTEVGAPLLLDRVEARLNDELPSPLERHRTPADSSAIDSRRSTMKVDEAPRTTDDATRVRPRVRPVFAFAGMALLLIVVVGVGAILLGGADAPMADTPATDADATTNTTQLSSADGSASTTVPSASTTLAVPVDVDTWVRVGEDSLREALGLFDITTFGQGYAAVGWGAGEDSAVGRVFLSDDGTDWRQVANDAPALTSSTTLLYSITEVGTGLMAAGVGCESGTDACVMGGAPWISEGGNDWVRTPHDAGAFGDPASQTSGIEDVITTSNGTLIAVGATDTWTSHEDSSLDTVETTPTVWSSNDGVVWEKVWEGAGFELSAAIWDQVHTSPMLAVAEAPDGRFTAVGKTLAPDGTPTAAAWTSPDGVLWEPVVAFEATFGENTTMTDIAWGPDGFVIVGTEGGHTPAIWRSDGPSFWTRISMFLKPFKGIGSLSSVATVDNGYVIAGPHPYLEQIGGAVTVWTSADGEHWDRVHQGGSGTVATVLADSDHTMLAGSAPSDGEWSGSVWVGPALDPTTPPPDPGENTWHPTPELTPVQWTIELDAGGRGIHRIFTVVEARPLLPADVAHLEGTLVWDEAEVQLCNIDIREDGGGYLYIGDGFQTNEQGGCEGTSTAMQNASDTFGVPDEACVAVITVDGRRHEYCAPLEEIG